MTGVWEVLRALEDLLCDFGWVRTPLGTSVSLCELLTISVSLVNVGLQSLTENLCSAPGLGASASELQPLEDLTSLAPSVTCTHIYIIKNSKNHLRFGKCKLGRVCTCL